MTRSAGSDLIVALCKAEQPGKALRVYHDMMASAFGAPGDASSKLPALEDGSAQGLLCESLYMALIEALAMPS